MTLNTELLFGKNPAAGGYQIERSLRFNSSDSAYLSKNFASAGNRKTWTWAGWVKRSVLGAAYKMIFSAGVAATECSLRFTNSPADALELYQYSGGGFNWQLVTTQVFRDPSSWYHIVAAVDSTQATSSDRAKLYVNGVQVTAFGTASYPTSNYDSLVNSTTEHGIGRVSASQYFDGYLADIHFIDGQALDPTSFGEFDANGVWQPKAYTGTYSGNSFHLPFSDNSTAAALGTDTSGAGNTWTVNNLQVDSSSRINWTAKTSITSGSIWGWSYLYWIFDANPATAAHSTGVITYSFAGGITVTSSLRLYTGMNVSHDPNVRIYIIINGTNYGNFAGDVTWRTVGFTGTINTLTLQGYNSSSPQALETFLGAIEVDGVQLLDNADAQNDSLVDTPTSYGTDTGAGGEVRGNYATLNPLANGGLTLANGNLDASRASASWVATLGTIGISSGKWYWEHTCTATQNSSNISTVGIATGGLGLTTMPGFTANGWVYVSESGSKWNNGSSASYGATWTNGDVIGIAFDADSGTLTFYKNNVSQGTAYTGLTSGPYFPVLSMYGTSSGPTNFGQRPFAYTAPSGFKALCTTNLPAPVVAKPSEVMDVKLYTGNGSTQTISGLGFSPDLVWVKSRSNAYGHQLVDSVRGSNLTLSTGFTFAEGDNPTRVTGFTSDGFSVGSDVNTNGSSSTYVAWTWDAGSSTVTNTQGSITSQVRANPSAGFSIVTYTGTGANATVGHGLGVAPQMFIVKNRSTSDDNWQVYHTSLIDANYRLILNSSQAADSVPGMWNGTAPTSTVFSVGTQSGSNKSGSSMIAYCFAPVAGYSAFGSYTGNGSADGPFVYTGFRPRFIMIKKTSGADDWVIQDTARDTYNVAASRLFPNLSNADNTASALTTDICSNGFKIRNTASQQNSSSATYIYAAFAEHPFQYARAR